MDRSRIGFVTGLTAEAHLLRNAGVLIGVGGGMPEGAAAAARRLVAEGATALVSFGLCGGLSPELAPGDLFVPEAIAEDGETYACDPVLFAWLGGRGPQRIMLATRTIAASAAEKAGLFKSSGADAVDMESGAVARVAHEGNLPFAVLRAVADPALRDMPPAAFIALSGGGKIQVLAVFASILRHPGQINGLIGLGMDAAKARAALVKAVKNLA